MKNEQGVPDKGVPRPALKRVNAKGGTTRRTFLGNVGKKALYVTPVVLTLSASEARAASPSPCLPIGSPCAVNEDCCSTICHPAQQICQCLESGEMCTADAECCSGICNQLGGMCD